MKNGDAMVLQIGTDEWPFPIPLVEREGRWHFDTDAGEQEILDRRIGRNELSTMQVVPRLRRRAARVLSAQPAERQAGAVRAACRQHAGEARRPLLADQGRRSAEPDRTVRRATRAARATRRSAAAPATPYHGYYYRILTAQGADAPGGAYDYVVRGAMIGGFALVAYPAEYDNSGVMTFLVNHDGVIYEKDLGPDTAKQARAMKPFNPDDTWKQVTPESDAESQPPKEGGAPPSPPGSAGARHAMTLR